MSAPFDFTGFRGCIEGKGRFETCPYGRNPGSVASGRKRARRRWRRQRSCAGYTLTPRFLDDCQVLMPFRFPRGTIQSVAGAEERLDVRRRPEGAGSPLNLTPLAGRGSPRCAHYLSPSSCPENETAVPLIGYRKLNSGRSGNRWLAARRPHTIHIHARDVNNAAPSRRLEKYPRMIQCRGRFETCRYVCGFDRCEGQDHDPVQAKAHRHMVSHPLGYLRLQ